MRFIQIATLLVAALFCSCGGKSKSATYEIGIDPYWYPLQLAGQEKNVLAFSIEMLTRIAKKEGLEMAVQRMSWDNLLWGLKQHKYNAVLSSLRPYAFYEKQFSFSDVYLFTGPVLVVLKESAIRSLEDLKGKEVAVIRGSSAALLLQTTPGIILQGYDSIPIALEALEKQDVNAAALEVLVAQNYVRDIYSETMKMLCSPLSNEGLRLVSLFHDSPKLMERFNKGLIALKKSGEYERLLEKWGLSPDGKPIANLDQEVEYFLNNSGILPIK
ncbi:MAG: Arginine-binding extracellular protein ArtP [Chlamydiae bacterium]|nr:Arginine-binding extracellular protein ArtP [Chlamydiota bacterium]